MGIETLDSQLLSLPAEERARLADLLSSSLEPELSSEELAEIQDAWLDEVERRSLQLERSEVETIPAQQVMAELRARLNR